MRCTSCGSSCTSSSCGDRRCSCRGRRRRPHRRSAASPRRPVHVEHLLCMSIEGSALVCTGLPCRIRRPPAGTFPAGGNAARGSCSLLRVICMVLKLLVYFCCECCRKRGGTPHFCGLQNDNFWLCVSLNVDGHRTASGQMSGPTCLVGPGRVEQVEAVPFAVEAGAVHGGYFFLPFFLFSRGRVRSRRGASPSSQNKGQGFEPNHLF